MKRKKPPRALPLGPRECFDCGRPRVVDRSHGDPVWLCDNTSCPLHFPLMGLFEVDADGTPKIAGLTVAELFKPLAEYASGQIIEFRLTVFGEARRQRCACLSTTLDGPFCAKCGGHLVIPEPQT